MMSPTHVWVWYSFIYLYVWYVFACVCGSVAGLDGKRLEVRLTGVVWIPDAGCHFALCSLGAFQSYKSCNDWT